MEQINKIKVNNISQKELGYLLGFYIGDGYSNYNSNDRHYRVDFYFHSKEKEIQRKIKEILKKIGLKSFEVKDKRYNSIKIFVNSKKLMNFLESKIKEIENRFFGTRKMKIGLISGFIDAEGYVKNGEILLTQKDKETLNLFKKILKSLNIETRKFWSENNYKSKNKIWRMRISTKLKHINHNSHKIKAQYGKVNKLQT